MTPRHEALSAAVADRFGETVKSVASICGEVTFEVDRSNLIEVATALRDEEAFRFETLIDLCGVDYLTYGQDEWRTESATSTGFSRAAVPKNIVPDADTTFDERRFAAVYHLLSVSLNHRLRLRVYAGSENPPIVPSVIDVWNGVNWFEREAFDLYGILFDGHPDLRRILTDYGFIGHPFRKDFPISGNVETRYDPDRGRVIYQPVSIEPRTLVPRVIRDDNRYADGVKDGQDDG